MTFHNTSNLSGDDLVRAVIASESQDDLVLRIFRGNKVSDDLSPSEVWDIGRMLGYDWLLTSVRRSITGLEHDGTLVKTDQQSQGKYGRPEYRWRLA